MARPFRGLNRGTGPLPSYDAVVIGAGIGGLTCANLLAREGLRVLLVEQHTAVGGYCSTFRRGGYTFDAASHFYPLLGNPETLTGRLLAELGVETRWVKMDPVDQFHLPDGTTFAVPADFGAYLARLKAEFPHESAAIDAFFHEAKRAYLLGLLCYFRGHDPTQLGPDRDLTVRQALDRHFHDRRLKLLLTADCPHWGAPPCRTSFVFDSMLRVSYFLGNYYPRGGSQAFADELARRFEEHGGHVLLGCAVRRIVTRRGRAVGVVVEAGHVRDRRLQPVAAGAVVTNADLTLTVERLLDADTLPPEYVAAVRRLRPTFPCFLAHIGVRGVPEGVLRRVHGYHWRDWDSDRVGGDAFRCKLFVPTLYEPALAPPGGHVVIVQKVVDVDYPAVTDWATHKAAIERDVLDHVERLIPGFGDRIVVKLSASAATSERFTWNRHGAMLGWEMSPGQLGPGRPDLTTPVEGLYLTGHWTRPGGGITPVLVSAVRAAELVVGARQGAAEPMVGAVA
ncbi:MAG TPA: NAD(P)/FAD-dependent oxidoreductase [Gemmataceae bacterium]|jgi:phytoene dehydrogenase-like protein